MLNPSETIENLGKKGIGSVTSAAKVSHSISARYAKALIDLASESGDTPKIERDLQAVIAILAESSPLKGLVVSPATTRRQAEKIMNILCDEIKAHGLTGNFLNLLIEKRRLPALEAISRAALREIARRRGEMNVEVKVAQDLTDEQRNALQDALSKNLGRKVAVNAKVEPDLLGGMIVTMGSKMIDDSVASKLRRLQSALEGKANQNIDEQKSRQA